MHRPHRRPAAALPHPGARPPLRRELSLRIALVGAGIVGVTTAYELALQGHEVTVFEARGGVATEASFAHAGIVAPGQLAPWAAPGMPWRAWRDLWSRHAALRLPWWWRWWRACKPLVHQRNRQAMHRLAQFSRLRLLELTRTLRLEYEQAPGLLVLLRAEREVQAAQAGLGLLRDWGVPHQLIDAESCRALEPGLHRGTALRAGIHLPQDGVGNCRQFAQLLKNEAQRLGARFHFNTAVRTLRPGTSPSLQLATGVVQSHDAVVVCAGAQAHGLLAEIGIRLPLAPVRGCSVTAPLRHLDGLPWPGPRAAVVDERHQVSISRLGQRLRIAGGAELGAPAGRPSSGMLRQLYRVLDDWYPGAALTHQAQHWHGARPMLPDGPPVLGASGAPGVWLNLGHGGGGWAMACGSARVLAELVAGREAPLDMAELTVARLR